MFTKVVQRLNLTPYMLKLHDSAAAFTPLLSSLSFIPEKARARTLSIYLRTKRKEEGKQALVRSIGEIPSRTLENSRNISTIGLVLYETFSFEELTDTVLPALVGKIERMRDLDEKQKLFICLMLGANDAARRYIESLPKLREPDFIIAGAEKAGTTWLLEAVGAHPDVWVPPIELHYFTSNNRRWTWEEYLALFSLNNKRITGEKSVTYLQVVDEIINRLPNAQVFIILRNPFDRLVSQYFHDLRNEAFSRRHKIAGLKDYVNRNIGDCLERGLYYQALKNNISKVNIMFFQDLASDPKNFLLSALSALGLTDIDPDRLVPQVIPKGKINRGDNRPKTSYKDFVEAEGITETLKEYYLNDIDQLQRATGRDLSDWMKW